MRVPTDVRAFTQFSVVGIALNGFIYVLYLVAASVGVAPIWAATIGWVVGVPAAFMANRSWTFGYSGARAAAFVRYALVYALAYGLNIVLLLVLVDQIGMPHEFVQGALIVAFGLSLYVAQRSWVFRKVPER